MLRTFIALFILAIAFQNCLSESRPRSSRSSQLSYDIEKGPVVLEGNGDIYDGKTEYVVVDREQECNAGPEEIKHSIKVENGRFFQVVKNCESIAPVALDAAKIEVAPHDTEILFYENQAYVDVEFFERPQALSMQTSSVCRKTEVDTVPGVVSVIHTYWSRYQYDTETIYAGRTVLGEYRATAGGNTYKLNSTVDFEEQILKMIADTDPMRNHLPQTDSSFGISDVFSYGGNFPAPNTYLLQLMAPSAGGGYGKGNLIMMENQSEHRILNMDCHSF